MNILNRILSWRDHFREQGTEPTFVPLTREELTVIASDRPYADLSSRLIPKVFGTPVFDSPFAPEMRQRQIDMPVTQLEESTEISWYRACVEEDREYLKIRHRLEARIYSNTTLLKLTFEWDVFAQLKRKLRLTKWFPVKSRTVTIEGRVLYPYLKVSLPHNKHHTTFKHVQ